MTIYEIVFTLLGGLFMLLTGAESLVRGSSALALRIGIAPLVVGLTVVALGTSSPELLVSVQAALDGNSSLSIGNVIGSNIANIALILGISSLIVPIKVKKRVTQKDLPILLIVSFVTIIFTLNDIIGFFEGIILVIGIVTFVVYNYLSGKKEKTISEEMASEVGIEQKKKSVVLSSIMLLAGLALLAYGSDFFVQGAVELAKLFEVSPMIIGLSIIAIGTSLPELVTSIVATMKDEGDLIIGNVIGSNIFNLLAILGITAIISPIDTSSLTMLDIIMMIGLSFLLWPISRTDFKLSRWEGAILLGIYATYLYFLFP